MMILIVDIRLSRELTISLKSSTFGCDWGGHSRAKTRAMLCVGGVMPITHGPSLRQDRNRNLIKSEAGQPAGISEDTSPNVICILSFIELNNLNIGSDQRMVAYRDKYDFTTARNKMILARKTFPNERKEIVECHPFHLRQIVKFK